VLESGANEFVELEAEDVQKLVSGCSRRPVPPAWQGGVHPPLPSTCSAGPLPPPSLSAPGGGGAGASSGVSGSQSYLAFQVCLITVYRIPEKDGKP
jgi:hypothetical protein